LVESALAAAGANPTMARSVARALVLAESQGLSGHGLSRVGQYCTHLRNGRADGNAVATVARQKGAAVLVNAGTGLAFPACDLAIATAISTARELGVCFAGVTNSHHAGVMVDHLRPVAAAGMVAIAFANSPAAMPAAGGRHPVFGTNPVAAIFPRRNGDPLMIDLSLSEVARGKLMVAAKKGESIPLGWALDKNGQPTTDPKAGLEGSMLPMGGVKGAMLALMVELMVTSLTGARFGMEADSFFEEQGNQPKIGQAFIVIDPAALGGTAVYQERVEALLAAMLADEGVRLPGYRRNAIAAKAQTAGIDLPPATLDPLLKLAA
jgi:(2R)-3-sulfolactate dehydrogenase (NADP+)